MSLRLTILILLYSISTHALAAGNCETKRIFELINQRLSYMEDVAMYKANKSLPIEDIEREKVVIARAVESALLLGFAKETIAPFYLAQIQVAKAIQYRVRANTIHSEDDKTGPDLISGIRPELLRLSKQINENIALCINDRTFAEKDREHFYKTINNPHITLQDKKVIFDSLSSIRMDIDR